MNRVKIFMVLKSLKTVNMLKKISKYQMQHEICLKKWYYLTSINF